MPGALARQNSTAELARDRGFGAGKAGDVERTGVRPGRQSGIVRNAVSALPARLKNGV
jgi:hypothetical protein